MSNRRHPKRKASIRQAAIFSVVVGLLLLLSPTAFAKTYVITDGDRTVTYTTFATDPAEVLDEAGMELDGLDSYTTGDGSSPSAGRWKFT